MWWTVSLSCAGLPGQAHMLPLNVEYDILSVQKLFNKMQHKDVEKAPKIA